MILMPQIFDVTANEKARYKRNELEYQLMKSDYQKNMATVFVWSYMYFNRTFAFHWCLYMYVKIYQTVKITLLV